ncbi:adenine methyltransferase, partial [bacterium]|nr:adenine methyltransferase [bacterium]
MAEWESNTGESDEWYTPPEIFKALDIIFDLDPCSPGEGHWVPAKNIYTRDDDGLRRQWDGTVFMNPPFGKRNGHVPWLEKFINHGDGIAIVRAYTSSGWFQEYIPRCDAVLFPKGKTKFVKPDGSIGKSPGSGIIMLAMGEKSVVSLRQS